MVSFDVNVFIELFLISVNAFIYVCVWFGGRS